MERENSIVSRGRQVTEMERGTRAGLADGSKFVYQDAPEQMARVQKVSSQDASSSNSHKKPTKMFSTTVYFFIC